MTLCFQSCIVYETCIKQQHFFPPAYRNVAITICMLIHAVAKTVLEIYAKEG